MNRRNFFLRALAGAAAAMVPGPIAKWLMPEKQPFDLFPHQEKLIGDLFYSTYEGKTYRLCVGHNGQVLWFDDKGNPAWVEPFKLSNHEIDVSIGFQ